MADSNTARRGDFLAVTLSLLAGIVQLLLFLIGTLGQVVGFQKLFARFDLIPFEIIISMIIALCIIGVISYSRKNQYALMIQPNRLFKLTIWLNSKLFVPNQSPYPQFQRTYIKLLIYSTYCMVGLTFIFVLSTLSYLNHNTYLFINDSNVDLWQTLSFVGLWTITPVILFMWLSDEIEKNYQFKPEDFLPNLIKSLQAQGYIQIKITSDTYPPGYMSHLIAANIQGTNMYFLVDYDGKKISRELSEDDYKKMLPPLQAQQ